MNVQLAVIAEGANVTPEAKLNILGEFNTLNAPSAPVFQPFMCFVAKLMIGAADGAVVDLRFRVVDGEGQLVAPEMKIRAEGTPSADGEPASFPLILPIAGAIFKEFGTYTFELWPGAGGPPLAEVPLYVKQVRAGA